MTVLNVASRLREAILLREHLRDLQENGCLCRIMDIGETLYVTSCTELRRWFVRNHQSRKEIWLVQYRNATKKPSINYVEAVEEAI